MATVFLKGTTLKVPSQLTSKEWQLYSSMEGHGKAARELNKALSQAMRAKTHAEASKIIWAALTKHRNFGATDSEPVYVADTYLNHKFGEE